MRRLSMLLVAFRAAALTACNARAPISDAAQVEVGNNAQPAAS